MCIANLQNTQATVYQMLLTLTLTTIKCELVTANYANYWWPHELINDHEEEKEDAAADLTTSYDDDYERYGEEDFLHKPEFANLPFYEQPNFYEKSFSKNQFYNRNFDSKEEDYVKNNEEAASKEAALNSYQETIYNYYYNKPKLLTKVSSLHNQNLNDLNKILGAENESTETNLNYLSKIEDELNQEIKVRQFIPLHLINNYDNENNKMSAEVKETQESPQWLLIKRPITTSNTLFQVESRQRQREPRIKKPPSLYNNKYNKIVNKLPCKNKEESYFSIERFFQPIMKYFIRLYTWLYVFYMDNLPVFVGAYRFAVKIYSVLHGYLLQGVYQIRLMLDQSVKLMEQQQTQLVDYEYKLGAEKKTEEV